MKLYRPFCAILLAVFILLAAGYAAAEKTVLLTFTGDVTLGGKDEGRNRPTSFDSVAKEKGYDYFFANFREMFENDDQTVINLEGVLTDKSYNEKSKKHPFRGATELAEILKRGNIDAASLSNNHFKDYGTQGQKSTKETLDKYGIAWFRQLKYYLYQKDGITVAFFALENTDMNTKQAEIYKTIKKAREEDGANAVVVCWHTGTEYKGYHNKDTEKRVNTLVNNGVDLVIINHPHVAQGMGVYNNRSVFYSLGNFVFGGNANIRTGKDSKDPYAISLYAMVVQARLVFADKGEYLGQQITVYPVFSSSARPDYKVGDDFPPSDRIMFTNDYMPMRLNLEQAEAVYKCIERDSDCEIPPMTTDENGLAKIVFPYLQAFEGVMIPEESENDENTIDFPEASNPKPTREGKSDTGN